MQRVFVWIVVPLLAACGRLAFDAASPSAGDDELPVGGCPLVLNLDRAQVQEPLVDFPLLVRLGSQHLDRTQLQPDARNLKFYLAHRGAVRRAGRVGRRCSRWCMSAGAGHAESGVPDDRLWMAA